MIRSPSTMFCLVFAIVMSQAVMAEDATTESTTESTTEDEAAISAQLQSEQPKMGSKILKGITSLFSLNNDEDEEAIKQAQEASNELFLDIQSLKADAITLNADLQLLEEELLFPVNTQITLFVSMKTQELFQLESVRVSLDGKLVSSYLYNEKEINALIRGGMQRLLVSNLGNGPHELVAVFTGVGPNQRDYERATSLQFEKQSGPSYFELRIEDSKAKNQPEFQVVRW